MCLSTLGNSFCSPLCKEMLSTNRIVLPRFLNGAKGKIYAGARFLLAPQALYFLLCLFLPTGLLFSQNAYLEPMGGTEVELFYHLDQAAGLGMQRNGGDISFKGGDLNAVYTISRGKVVEVHFDQLFPNKESATQTFDKTLVLLQERGIPMKVIPTSQLARILRGEGNGLRSSLVLVPCPKGYRLEASIAEMH